MISIAAILVLSVCSSGRSCSAQEHSGKFRPQVNSWYKITNTESGLALNVAGGSTEPGAQVWQWKFDDSLVESQWRIEPAQAGFHVIVNRHSGLCLGIREQAAKRKGAKAIQLPKETQVGDTCLWRFKSLGGDQYAIINKASGFCLNVRAASKEQGATVWQWSLDENASESRWKIKQVDSPTESVGRANPAQPKRKKPSMPEDRPFSGESAASLTRDEPSGPTVQEVICEGIGATPDEAQKDAFRNAVRQVVGTVVDAETLVKNDDVIDDAVLTFSGGFVKKWDVLTTKSENGVHRVTIKAVVERSNVIAKLKAANVTMRDIDGSGLFAQVVTQLDAEKNANDILKHLLHGFPENSLKAVVTGEPEVVEKSDEKVTVKIRVRLKCDMKAYKSFVQRLQPILEKMCSRKGEFTLTYKQKDQGPLWIREDLFGGRQAVDLSQILRERVVFPGLEGKKPDHVTLVVGISRSQTGDRIEYRYFVLGSTVGQPFAEIAAKEGRAKLSLLREDGEVVLVDRFPLKETWEPSEQHFEGSLFVLMTDPPVNCYGSFPVFAKDNSLRFADLRAYKPELRFERTLTLTLDELKAVKEARCEISFE